MSKASVFLWTFLACKSLREPSSWRWIKVYVLSRAQRWNRQQGALRLQKWSRLQLVRRMCECLCCVRTKHMDLIWNKQLKGQVLRLVPRMAKQTVLLENFLCETIHQHPALHLHSRRPWIPPSGWVQSHLSFLCMLKHISSSTNNNHWEVMEPLASFEQIVNLSRYIHVQILYFLPMIGQKKYKKRKYKKRVFPKCYIYTIIWLSSSECI